jgi:phage host-nuclease inhibitor protein Gam
MSRQKVNEAPLLETWDSVDQALKRAGQISRIVQAAEAEAQKAIDEATEKAAKKTAELLAEKASIEKNLEAFCVYYRDRFGEKKSRELNFGTVGWRESSKVAFLKGWTQKKVVRKLQALRLEKFLIKKDPTVDKEAIKKAGLPAVKLKSYGVEIVTKDTFFYEPDETKIADVPSMEIHRASEAGA